MNAFEVLGLNEDADEAQVRRAYHQQVKVCHPDQFADGDAQRQAQDKLIQLNLAYEEALRKTAAQPSPASHTLSVEEAKRLLLSTNLPVSEVAGMAGYENISYFSTVFRKRTGMSPVDWRNSGGGGETP